MKKGDKVVANPIPLLYVKSKFKKGEVLNYTGIKSNSNHPEYGWREFTNGTITDILFNEEYTPILNTDNL